MRTRIQNFLKKKKKKWETVLHNYGLYCTVAHCAACAAVRLAAVQISRCEMCPACTLSSYDWILKQKTCLIIAERVLLNRGADKGTIIAKYVSYDGTSIKQLYSKINKKIIGIIINKVRNRVQINKKLKKKVWETVLYNNGLHCTVTHCATVRERSSADQQSADVRCVQPVLYHPMAKF